MYPEDPVLVGVMQHPRDFKIAQDQGWYRIPYGKATPWIQHDKAYIAFFFGNRFKENGKAIHYYAERRGVELTTRAQLLPDDDHQGKAHKKYYKVQFREIHAKVPPITNPSKRRFAFIYTTWDRFCEAETIDDLYSKADHLVDRIYYALKGEGYQLKRSWEISDEYPYQHRRVRVLCEGNDLTISSGLADGINVTDDTNLNLLLDQVKHEIATRGGIQTLSTPLD